MDKEDRRVLDELESDFHKVASQPAWSDNDIEKMKNLQKLMYYMEVRCAMKEGREYPGSEHMEDWDSRKSYARSMPVRRMSYTFPYGYPSGRRYYDSGRGNWIEDIRHMVSMEQDPEIREQLEHAMRMREEK